MKEFDWSECPEVWRDSQRMGGQWCFDQTRLPISYLFANLADGVTVEEFAEMYEVDAESCHEVLRFAAVHSTRPAADNLAIAA